MDIQNADLIYDLSPAVEWAEGYPVGNGRLGAMVPGRPALDRISLNHELLWRGYIGYARRHTNRDIDEVKALCAKGCYDEADALLRKTVPDTGRALYINPYVPACNLFISMAHHENISCYRRVLNMGEGTAALYYNANGVNFTRESFCSPSGVIVTRICADRAGRISGELSMSRLADPDCEVTGRGEYKLLELTGVFEEGRRFAAATKIYTRGGRVAIGRREYAKIPGPEPKKVTELEYVFSCEQDFDPRAGVSLLFSCCDEVLILTSIAVDSEAAVLSLTPEELCLRLFPEKAPDYDVLRAESTAAHKKLYSKTCVSFEDTYVNHSCSARELLEKCGEQGRVLPALAQKLFKLARYLAICSGTPRGEKAASGGIDAPINLQGIWNQDRFPAWECDYHTDLNLAMCYWHLDSLNLSELVPPLMDWIKRLSPQFRDSARDLYGCGGLVINGCCDIETLGTPDSVGFGFTGAAAWFAQILWRHYEYTGDKGFLENDLFPFMEEIAGFYTDFLSERDGVLLPPFGSSPEVQVIRGENRSFFASAASIDIELARALFENLIAASKILGRDGGVYEAVFERLPLPKMRNGAVSEFWEDYTPADPGHRHRSLLVGLCPGTRISAIKTPDWAAAAYKTIKDRHAGEDSMSIGLTYALDAQLLARLGRGDEAFSQIYKFAYAHLLPNLLSTINDYAGKLGGEVWFKGHKLFQIEASIGIGGAIADMLLSDREGYITLLPALPGGLKTGSAQGLPAAGGFSLSFEWEEMRLTGASLLSKRGGPCGVSLPAGTALLGIKDGQNNVCFEEKDGVLRFETSENSRYDLIFSRR